MHGLLFLLFLEFCESMPWEIRRDSRDVVVSVIHRRDGALGDFVRDVLVLIRVDNFEVICLFACLFDSSLAIVPV